MPNTTKYTIVGTEDRTIRVCVLTPSYENSDSATKEWDSIVATPQHFFPEGFVDVTYEKINTDDENGNDADGGEEKSNNITSQDKKNTRKKRERKQINTKYTFSYIELKKATVYRDLRSIIKSGHYDVFFNLCDGAKDEDRAGEEVVRTLEEFNVPFTGASSKYFELSKPDMKMMAHYSKINTARHAVLDANDLLPLEEDNGEAARRDPTGGAFPSNSPSKKEVAELLLGSSPSAEGGDSGIDSAAATTNTTAAATFGISPHILDESIHLRLEPKCAHLRFPVIVKHVSGYASIGMTKENKCKTLQELKERAAIFIKEFDFALVEEFITGDEATVLACADDSGSDDEDSSDDDDDEAKTKSVGGNGKSVRAGGVRVFHPVMVNFPEGSDFKHFELKWTAYEGMEWQQVPLDDPSLPQILEVGRKAFKEMMGGVGYGRCDLRINRETNEVVFLEINPNCGIMYPQGQEGSADYILRMEGEKAQRLAALKKQKKSGAAATSSSTSADKDDVIIDKDKGQRDFAILQIKVAMARSERTKPLWFRSYDKERDFHLRAARDIKKGQTVFNDEGRSFRLFTKPYVDANWSEEEKAQFNENAWPIGGTAAQQHYFAVWDVNPANWRIFNNSTDGTANLIFAPNRSLNVIAARNIKKGEELTMNYDLLRNESMPEPKKRQ